MDMEAKSNTDWAPSIDHILEVILGGSNDVSNLQSAHRWCNSKRSTELALKVQRQEEAA
jgi:5-methylcytosine-specific restriction endonuclease McrA